MDLDDSRNKVIFQTNDENTDTAEFKAIKLVDYFKQKNDGSVIYETKIWKK
jgi:hypothetical protein